MSCDSFDPDTNERIGRQNGRKNHLNSLWKVRQLCYEYKVHVAIGGWSQIFLKIQIFDLNRDNYICYLFKKNAFIIINNIMTYMNVYIISVRLFGAS